LPARTEAKELFSETAKSERWRHRSNESDGVSQVMAGLLRKYAFQNCLVTTVPVIQPPYILSNIYDFTLFTLLMMVILIAVYTVVLVLLKDQ